MNEQFINVYIETIFNELNNTIKEKLMLQTRLSIAEQLITNLNQEKLKLEDELKKNSPQEKNENF